MQRHLCLLPDGLLCLWLSLRLSLSLIDLECVLVGLCK